MLSLWTHIACLETGGATPDCDVFALFCRLLPL